jgi:hypothetical protein
MVKEGRMMVGKPMPAWICIASSMLWARAERGLARPMRAMACLNFSRSSALSMASLEAPIRVTPYFSSTPCLARSSAQFSAVWPPMVGRIASGRSFSRMRPTVCQLMGSM